MIVGFGSSSSINDSNEMLGCEFLSLSHIRSIEDRVPRFCHVTREEEALRDLIRLILNRCLKFSNGSSNTGRCNSLNEWLGLIRLTKKIVVHLDAATYPLT